MQRIQYQSLFLPLRPPESPAAPNGWQACAPESTTRRRQPRHQSTFEVYPAPQATTPNGWQPNFPDTISTRENVEQQFVFNPIDVPAAPVPNGWQTYYPDRVDSRLPIVGDDAGFASTILGPLPPNTPTGIEWLATYQDVAFPIPLRHHPESLSQLLRPIPPSPPPPPPPPPSGWIDLGPCDCCGVPYPYYYYPYYAGGGPIPENTVTVPCCPNPIPRTLYATVTSACGVFDGLNFPLEFDDGLQQWYGETELTDCDGCTVFSLTVRCNEGALELITVVGDPPACTFSTLDVSTLSTQCDPLLIEFTSGTIVGPCCAGDTFTVTITE